MNKFFILILLLVLYSVSTSLSRKNTSPKKKQKIPPTVASQDLCDIHGCVKTVTVEKGNSASLVCMVNAEEYGCAGENLLFIRTRSVLKISWFRLINSTFARPVADDLKPCSFVTEMSDFTLTLFNVSDEMAGSYMCNISVYSINDCRLCDLCDPNGMKTNNCFETLGVNLTATFHVSLDHSSSTVTYGDVTPSTRDAEDVNDDSVTYDFPISHQAMTTFEDDSACVMPDTSAATWSFAAVYFANKTSDPLVHEYFLTKDFTEEVCPTRCLGSNERGKEMLCNWHCDNVVHFVSVDRGNSVTLECDIASWVPITYIQWTFRNISGTVVLSAENTHLGNWQARKQRWSLVLKHLGGAFTWCDVSCEPVWYGPRHPELAHLRNVTWKVDVVDLNLDRGPEPMFIIMDERRVGNKHYDEVVVCINVDLPQHWMRAVVTAREQNVPNLTEAMSIWNKSLHYSVVQHSFLLEISSPRAKLRLLNAVYSLMMCSKLSLDFDGDQPSRLLAQYVYVNWTLVSRVNPSWQMSVVEPVERLNYKEMAALTKVLPQDDKDDTIAGKENRETFGGKLHETIIIVALFLSFGVVVGVVVVAVRVGHFVYKKKHVDIEVASTQRVEKIVKMNLLGGNKDNLSVVSVNPQYLSNSSVVSVNPQYLSLRGSNGSTDTSSATRSPLTSTSTVPEEIDCDPVCSEVTIEVAGATAGKEQVTALVNKSLYIIPLDTKWEVPRDKVNVMTESILGSGEFGAVYAAEVLQSRRNIRVAAKTVKEDATDEELQMLLSELAMLKYVNSQAHPNVIGLIGCCTQGGTLPVYVLTERASRGSLIGVLTSCRTALANHSVPLIITRNHLVELAIQITRGLCHLAELQVVHRDLACRNILVMFDFTVKIADFGMTRRTTHSYYCRSSDMRMPYRWLSPEALRRLKFSFASDIWAMGVVMWEMFTLGQQPYKNNVNGITSLLTALDNGRRLPQPPGISNEVYAAMLWCWEMKPRHRPLAEELLGVLQTIQAGMTAGQFLTLTGEMDDWCDLVPESQVRDE